MRGEDNVGSASPGGGPASRAVVEALVALRGDRADEIRQCWREGKLTAEYAEAALKQEREAEAERMQQNYGSALYEQRCETRWRMVQTDRGEHRARLDADYGLSLYGDGETLAEMVARQNRRFSR